MSARVVRAHYDELGKIASAFAQHAELTRKTLQDLRQQQEILQGGDWIGKGAQAFYAEMNAQVMPTIERLSRALQQAADTTHQISQIVQQAEAEAASLFRLNGATAGPASGTNGAVGGAPVPSGSAFVDARPSKVRTRSRPQTGSMVPKTILGQLAAINPKLSEMVSQDPLLVNKLEQLDQDRWKIEMGKNMGDLVWQGDRAAHKLIINPDRLVESLTKASNEMLYGNIKLLDKLDPKLVDQAEKNPILMEQLRQLDHDRWQVEMGQAPGVSTMGFEGKSIRLDPKNPMESLTDSVRSAIRGPEKEIPLSPNLSRGEYTALNQDVKLKADARELLSYYQAHQNVYNTMPDKLPFTTNGKTSRYAERYKQIAAQEQDGTISRAQAVESILTTFALEPTGITRRDEYRDMFWEKWDNAHEPPK